MQDQQVLSNVYFGYIHFAGLFLSVPTRVSRANTQNLRYCGEHRNGIFFLVSPTT